VLDALADAGCTEVFVGVDAVSPDAKRSFAKHFYKGWASLEARLRACLERGIVPTCAFMIDVPGEDTVNTDAALTTALFARNLGCGIRLNTLTLYNGTGSAEEMAGQARSYTDLKPRLLLDTPEVIQDNPLARERPELFPFHHTYLPLPLYRRFVSGMHAAYTLFTAFPRTLLQYVAVDGGGLWRLLERVTDEVGDLALLPARQRRPAEREAFLNWFPGEELSGPARAALELELAELRLGGEAEREAVEVLAEGGSTRCRAGRFEVVALPAEPDAFSQALSGPEGHGAAGPYLLVRRGRRIEYFALGEEAAGALRRIGAGGPSGPVVVPAPLVEELLGAGALHLASPA
jgi:hypothetical protein